MISDFFSYVFADHRDLHSFPTRRSSDLAEDDHRPREQRMGDALVDVCMRALDNGLVPQRDRKSTRLNSSHLGTSYAVFCWNKKITTLTKPTRAKAVAPYSVCSCQSTFQ